MLLLQAAHTFFLLLFPVLNYWRSKSDSQIASLKAYFYYISVVLLIFGIYVLDYYRTYTAKDSARKFLKFLKYSILTPIIAIIFITLLYIQVTDAKFRVLVALGGMLIGIISILGASTFQKQGLKEILYVIILGPVFFLCNNMILFNEFDFKTLVKFGPISFLFLGSLISYGARKTVVAKDQAASVLSLPALLGKNDSFRALFLMISYCYLHTFIIGVQNFSIVHLIPPIYLTIFFYKILYSFWSGNYEECYAVMWKIYLIYSTLFILCTVVYQVEPEEEGSQPVEV